MSRLRFACHFAALVTIGACASAPGPTPAPTGPGGAAAPMTTDRPDFTESATAVRPGRIQLEAGYTMDRSDGGTDHSIGELLVRVGVVPGAELRVGPGSYGVVSPADGPRRTGAREASIGVKVELPAGALAGELALLAGSAVPLPSDLEDGGWSPSAVLAGAWTAGAVGLGANAGYTYVPGDGGGGEWLGSVAAGLPLGDGLGGFLELYGFLAGHGDPRSFVDGGVTFSLTPDVQLDLRAGHSLQAPRRLLLGFGLSTRW